jgi:hypothetical protein
MKVFGFIVLNRENEVVLQLENSFQTLDSPPHHSQVIFGHEQFFATEVNSDGSEHEAVRV